MFKLFKLDKDLRYLISFAFRICILIYSILIINLQRNFFTWYWYGFAGILYTFIYTILKKKEDWKSKARLLNDYLFITFVLWGKPFTFLNACLLLLPLFNAPNHSGEKRSIFLYFFLALSGMLLFKSNLSKLDILPLIFIFTLNVFQVLRTRMIRFAAFLQETLDEFYLSYFNFYKSHILYKKLIDKLNNSKFQKLATIDNILCFVKKEDRIIIANGSVFIWTYDLPLTETDYTKLENKGMLQDKQIIVNNKTHNKNSIFQVSAQGEKYIYVINHAERGIFYFFNPIYINQLVRPLFHKIAETIYLERSLRFINNNNIKKIKNKLVYVNNATLAMHFLRNKMSPIIGYFDTLELIEHEVNEDQKKHLHSFLNKLHDKARPALKDILARANMILEKSENPFVISNFTLFSPRKIFDTARKIWLEYFDPAQISLSWNITEIASQYQFELNEEYLGIVFTDIIKNMENYHKGIVMLEFDEKPESFILRFKNNFDPSQRIETDKICIDFMSEENEEINKRITHGLTMIKSFLKQMAIDYKLFTFDNFYTFELYFKKAS